MTKTRIATLAPVLFIAACAGAGLETESQGDGLSADVEACVHLRERVWTCREPVMEPWIAARARFRPDLAAALATPEGAAEVKQVFLQEAEADGAGPLAPRQAKCEAVVADTPPEAQAHVDAMLACDVHAECSAWAACVVPAFEAMLAAPR